MQTHLLKFGEFHPSDKKTQRIMIELVLSWFQTHQSQTYYPYHTICEDVLRFYRKICETDLQNLSLETIELLDILEQILDSLALLGYGEWCEIFNKVDTREYYYIQKINSLTVEQIAWHFQMKKCAEWLDCWISQNMVPLEIRNGLYLLKNRLLKCKSKTDFQKYVQLYLQKACKFRSEIHQIIATMKNSIYLEI
ncbi:MAG: hypothetical protein ACFFD2_04735 [Promethearchaeota archaeon]